jgi:hypothetical protein
MSGRKNKHLRKIAREMSQGAINEMVANTNDVILAMQQNWPREDKLEFCKWFLDGEMPEWMSVKEPADPAQLEFDFEGGHDDARGEGQG